MAEDNKDQSPQKTEAEWLQELTPEQYYVTCQCGTEPPFTGCYYQFDKDGIYNCVCCGAPLFRSEHKFDSGTGWPSYWQPASEDALTRIEDRSHGMVRVEVRCARCDAHLGHQFPDGPPPTGMRYCINSASLAFDEKE